VNEDMVAEAFSSQLSLMIRLQAEETTKLDRQQQQRSIDFYFLKDLGFGRKTIRAHPATASLLFSIPLYDEC
jgi:hypothetical protein